MPDDRPRPAQPVPYAKRANPKPADNPFDFSNPPKPAPPVPEPDPEPEPRVRSRRSRFPVVALAAALGFAGLMVAGTLAFFLVPGSPGNEPLAVVVGPSPEREGVTWDYKDLAGYLNSKGLATFQEPYGLSGVFIGIDGDSVSNASVWDREERRLMLSDGVVAVKKIKGDSDLKLEESRHANGTVFAWGRFLFQASDTKYLNRIRAALP